jgi:battenin
VGTSRSGCAHWCRALLSTPLSLLRRVSLASLTSQVLPLVIPLTYFLLLPRPDAFSPLATSDTEEAVPSSEYVPLPVSEEDAGEAVVETAPLKTKTLTIGDKWQLLKPMLPRYMAPLCMCS